MIHRWNFQIEDFEILKDWLRDYHHTDLQDYWIKITLANVLSKSHCPTKGPSNGPNCTIFEFTVLHGHGRYHPILNIFTLKLRPVPHRQGAYTHTWLLEIAKESTDVSKLQVSTIPIILRVRPTYITLKLSHLLVIKKLIRFFLIFFLRK